MLFPIFGGLYPFILAFFIGLIPTCSADWGPNGWEKRFSADCHSTQASKDDCTFKANCIIDKSKKDDNSNRRDSVLDLNSCFGIVQRKPNNYYMFDWRNTKETFE